MLPTQAKAWASAREPLAGGGEVFGLRPGVCPALGTADGLGSIRGGLARAASCRHPNRPPGGRPSRRSHTRCGPGALLTCPSGAWRSAGAPSDTFPVRFDQCPLFTVLFSRASPETLRYCRAAAKSAHLLAAAAKRCDRPQPAWSPQALYKAGTSGETGMLG